IAALRRKPGEPPRFSDDLTEIAGAIAADERLEHAYRALALALPGEAEIARQIGQNIDPDAIHFTREALASAMARANGQNYRRKYEELDDTRPFSPDAASAGRRSLRNALLDYLALLDGGAELAARHFAGATNMTDRAAALSVLV